MCQAAQDARRDQRRVIWRLPGDQISHGEQGHQPEQQGLAGQAPRQRGEYRRADGNTKRIQADKQAGRGQRDMQAGGNGGDEADDDEFCGADGKGAQRERP